MKNFKGEKKESNINDAKVFTDRIINKVRLKKLFILAAFSIW